MSGRPSSAIGYGSKWRRLRDAHLCLEPLCRYCKQAGQIVPACEVDHVIPHRGDRQLFWDANNLQSLCKPCHAGTKQAIEARGYDHQVGNDGWPVDPKHPANAAKPPHIQRVNKPWAAWRGGGDSK